MSSTMISSAVVIPDQQPTEETLRSPSHSPSLKRRPSSLSLENTTTSTSKRPRLDSTTNNPSIHSPPLNPATSTATSPPHRKPSQNTTEEKRRNRRLFGTLLTTLSQTTVKPNKKRDEIEKRQIERVRRDQEEREEERRRRKQELEIQRGEEWRVWEEESRRVMGRNRRAVAGFLRTETEPRLYWRPWELREGERERVKVQREGVEEEIQREEEEMNGKREGKVEGRLVENDERKGGGGAAHGKMEIDEDGKKEEPSNDQNGDGKEKTAEDAIADAPARPDEETRTPAVEEKPKEEDHGGEELVEGHEDDVIY